MSLRRLGALALLAGLGLSAGCSLSRNDCGEQRPGLLSRLRGCHGTPCCNGGGEGFDYGPVVSGPALPPIGPEGPYPPPGDPALLPAPNGSIIQPRPFPPGTAFPDATPVPAGPSQPAKNSGKTVSKPGI